MTGIADLGIGAPGAPELDDDEGLELGVNDGAPPPSDATAPGVEFATERQVRTMLRGLGGALHHVIGDPDVERHWRFTDEELDALTPPMTAIVNRRPALRRAVARGDELTVAVELAGYVNRNLRTGQEAKEAREREDEHGEGDRGSERGAAGAGEAAGVYGWDRGRDRGGHGGGPDRGEA